MDFFFDTAIASAYSSSTQKVRVMSETWVGQNIYCPCCGNGHICKFENNKPVADFYCERCGEIFELKSKNGSIDKKIADGAYSTMIERITSTTNPDLFVLRYSPAFEVTDLLIIPKFFFTPQVIEKRKPLSENASRSGWTGCNILLSEIPMQGRISVIENRSLQPPEKVVEQYKHISKMKTDSIDGRSWLFDTLACVNKIEKPEFSLTEVYAFKEDLKSKHPDNNNIEAKIRQQLQNLRDKGIIEFVGRGSYRKI